MVVVKGGVDDDEALEALDVLVLLAPELGQLSRLVRLHHRLPLGLLDGKTKSLGVPPAEPPSVRLHHRKRPAADPREEPLVLVGLRR